MTPRHYDVIVAGLGAMGSATLAHLALRGQRVLGIERWIPGHPHGSSHGDSRIIREMYFEHPMYVPLVQRAHELWRDLEARTGATLMHTVGGLMIGPEDGGLVQGTLRSAREYSLPFEILSGDETRRRHPAFDLSKELVAVFDPRAGYLDPEACNAAHLKVASRHGAEVRFEEPVLSWKPEGDGATVTTSLGSYTADRLVISTGARLNNLLAGLPLEVERQVLFWFDPPNSQDFGSDRMPIWIYEHTPGEICYGFPKLPRGVKASGMHSGKIYNDAGEVDREIGSDEVQPLLRALGRILPSLAGARVIDSQTCIFTNTPDQNFIIDFHPQHPQVLISSACSGHGFKFASAIGELQADLVTGNGSSLDLKPFSLERFV